MDLKALGRDWAVADRIMTGWLNGTPVSAIDKDIVLEKLRRIYEEVYVADYLESRVPEPEPMPEPEPEPMFEPMPEPVEFPAGDMLAETDEPVSEPECEPVSEPECEENIPADKAKIDRRALLSLYDDPVETDIPAAGPVNVPEPVIAHGDTAGPVRVWGEVAGGEPTIADAYAGSVHDMASELGGGPVNSLREAIGVNDKFRMVRDMFGSDVDAYDDAIARFEGFTDLDDAMVYMYENFSWNPDDESVKMLVDLLTRKLA